MKGLVVLAHPAGESFNAALADRVVNRLRADGNEIIFHDLYAERFDPIVDAVDLGRAIESLPMAVCDYCEELKATDALVIIHPSWWGQPPAVMKGWVDRVFRAGVAYRFVDQGNGVGVPQGMLQADRALVLNTSNSAPGQWGGADPLEEWWRNTVLGMCGVKHVTRRLFAPMITSTPEQREQWLHDAEEVASEVFKAPVAVG